MSIELKECTRLSARITEDACRRNRKAGSIFACEGCPGLGAVVAVAPRVSEQLPTGFMLELSDDNLHVFRRFEKLSSSCGGNPIDDLFTIIDLYLDGDLQFREG